MVNDRHVVSTFNYIAPMDAEPEIYFYEPEPGTVKHDPVTDPREMRIHDIRGREREFSLDEHGFEVIDIDAEVTAFGDRAEVQASYYPAVAERVKEAVGASHVHVFDHNFRSRSVTDTDVSEALPVMWVHNDYTELSGPQRIRDLMADRAEELLQGRYAFINLWRPVTRTVEESPLAVLAARSVRQSDFVTLALRYADRDGQIYFMRHNPDHQWFYASRMRTNEALLLKCFDSARDGRVRYTAHSAFEDPASPPDAEPRESIEARTIAFFE